VSHKPTAEQAEIVYAFGLGGHLVIEAGAGTGKTSTLKMLAASSPHERGVYIAYNRAIADEASRSFPNTVLCKTAHGLAYGAVGNRYRHRLNGPRQRAQDTARILRINEPLRIADDRAPLSPHQLARLVSETLQRFCYSADEHIQRMHVPLINGVDTPAERAALAAYLVPIAQRAWDEDITRVDGQLRFTHDMYLKIWILARPQLPGDYVLLDEAQDSNPAVAGLVADQNAQRILVGDRSQAIYGWRGAVDAMAGFDGDRFQLSQSFRFGEAIADEANKWLTVLDAPLRLTGYDQISSTVGPVDAPDAVLCRSNAGAISRVMTAMARGRRAALVGGGTDIKRMAEGARALQLNLGTDHPELFCFQSWAEVQAYVEQDKTAQDLRTFVRLIDRWGADEVIRCCERLVDERQADVIVSTAHKAKGREWRTVQIATDFQEPKPADDGTLRVYADEAMLAYVSVTRAQVRLDREGLSWIDQLGDPEPVDPVHSVDRLIAASSLGTPEAVALRESASAAGELTEMPEEQADWQETAEPAAPPVDALTAAARQVDAQYGGRALLWKKPAGWTDAEWDTHRADRDLATVGQCRAWRRDVAAGMDRHEAAARALLEVA
jgi:hypothetical protein